MVRVASTSPSVAGDATNTTTPNTTAAPSTPPINFLMSNNTIANVTVNADGNDNGDANDLIEDFHKDANSNNNNEQDNNDEDNNMGDSVGNTASTSYIADTNWQALKTMLSERSAGNRRIALIAIKNAIIGSNRQKGAFIENDMVPIVIKIATSKDELINDKLDALIILTSISKGTREHVELLIEKYDIIPIIINDLLKEQQALEYRDQKVIECCLSIMQSIFMYRYVSVESYFDPDNHNDATISNAVKVFLDLANEHSTINTQIAVSGILTYLCNTYEDQIKLLSAGTINVLARMIYTKNRHIQHGALRCLARMCYSNRYVSDSVCVASYQGISFPDILNSLMSRLLTPEIQLTAATCLTYIYRSGTLPPSDYRITHGTLPTLSRLCADKYCDNVRWLAAEICACLIELDADLQQVAAISNNLLKSLTQLMNGPKSTMKQAALKCFTSLGANNEAIRKLIITTSNLTEIILDGLSEKDTPTALASMRCLHIMSRSVEQLRTTFQDYTIWKPVIDLLSHDSTNEFLIAATATVCNMLLEFSSSKDALINAGVIAKLSHFSTHSTLLVRLNSIWGLMNMSFQTNQFIKISIVNTMGTLRIINLLKDEDTDVILKTLGLLRNILSEAYLIEFVMSPEHNAKEILDIFNTILNNDEYPVELKEQTLCVVANIASEAESNTYITDDEQLMTTVGKMVFSTEHCIQYSALFAINNILHRADDAAKEKFLKNSKNDILKIIQEFKKIVTNPNDYYVFETMNQIVYQCNIFCPEVKN